MNWHELSQNYKLLFAVFGYVALHAVTAYFRSPKIKGRRGEAKVASRLQKVFGSDDAVILNDLTLPTGDGTTQVDHVLIAPSGVFVIETKNMGGWIFGGKDQARWTQAKRGQKFRFQNPLRQNFKHVKVVEQLLGLKAEHVFNVVVFVGDAEPQTNMPINVLWNTEALTNYLSQARKTLFTAHEVQQMARDLKSQSMPSGRKTNRAHVARLRANANMRNNSENCPVCGSKLVERQNRDTGQGFLGCSAFPKCEGTRAL